VSTKIKPNRGGMVPLSTAQFAGFDPVPRQPAQIVLAAPRSRSPRPHRGLRLLARLVIIAGTFVLAAFGGRLAAGSGAAPPTVAEYPREAPRLTRELLAGMP
jgi:hypothetical protein